MFLEAPPVARTLDNLPIMKICNFTVYEMIFRNGVARGSNNLPEKIYQNQSIQHVMNTFSKNTEMLQTKLLLALLDKITQKESNIIFLDSTKLKIVWIKITTFSNDAFQSYYKLFQVNCLV